MARRHEVPPRVAGNPYEDGGSYVQNRSDQKQGAWLNRAKALYLMLPQQEGHDNSGYAMVMQDLYGVFEGHKDKPLLSLACTPRGVRMVDAYMAEQGFEQVLEWLPDVDLAARPRYQGHALLCVP